ncbi:hypothetical protein TNCT_569011 [Trichonephila clavata]|uniref:Uncharacterized protein n=1 Tax=Trichonephila clavata TaxID=2740835 RepID=A0A8X6L2P1_TRICU|nr:hypothetical protein TNCT_569011 [Trichonephila clavata]
MTDSCSGRRAKAGRPSTTETGPIGQTHRQNPRPRAWELLATHPREKPLETILSSKTQIYSERLSKQGMCMPPEPEN